MDQDFVIVSLYGPNRDNPEFEEQMAFKILLLEETGIFTLD